jgi:hypothetical protein
MTFTRTIITQALLLVLLMGGIAHGFVAPSSRFASSSTTQLQLFGWGSTSGGDDKKKTVKKAAPKNVKKEETKKEPFVFLFGRPQHNWVTMEKYATSDKKKNWVVKAEDYAKPKK